MFLFFTNSDCASTWLTFRVGLTSRDIDLKALRLVSQAGYDRGCQHGQETEHINNLISR
jgi:hypothetical protein